LYILYVPLLVGWAAVSLFDGHPHRTPATTHGRRPRARALSFLSFSLLLSFVFFCAKIINPSIPTTNCGAAAAGRGPFPKDLFHSKNKERQRSDKYTAHICCIVQPAIVLSEAFQKLLADLLF
jgi:hypothetical protein